MSKFLIAACTAMFVFSSAGVMASGNLSSSAEPMTAQEILNKMACADKKPSDKIKDRIDGKMVTCKDTVKSGDKAKKPSGGGY